MANKTEAEILEELDNLEKLLRMQLQTEGAFLFLDLDFIAGMQRDLKQELRIAKARGE